MEGKKTASGAGWERPIHCPPQLALFGNERDAVLASAYVSLDDMARWQRSGWISFDAASVDDLDEAQRAEILFVRDIARSGLPDAVVSRLLSELPSPYAYPSERVAYSFRVGWVQLPFPVSMDKIMGADFDQWLNEQVDEGNLEHLEGILEQVTQAIDDCSSRLRRVKDDPS